MNVFHVMISVERRKAPRELAIPISDQLHTMGASVSDLTDPQIIYAAEWDQVSPWIVLLKGDRSTLKMSYLGWPTMTQAEWMAANQVVTQ